MDIKWLFNVQKLFHVKNQPDESLKELEEHVI
jgi:hypothetical protein